MLRDMRVEMSRVARSLSKNPVNALSGIHCVRLILPKINIIIWISENQELHQGSSDSRTNSKCRRGCKDFIYI